MTYPPQMKSKFTKQELELIYEMAITEIEIAKTAIIPEWRLASFRKTYKLLNSILLKATPKK